MRIRPMTVIVIALVLFFLAPTFIPAVILGATQLVMPILVLAVPVLLVLGLAKMVSNGKRHRR